MPWSQQRIIAQDTLSKEESFFLSIIFMIYLCLFLSIELSFNIFVYFPLISEMWVFFFLLVSGLCLHVFLGTPSYRGTYMDRNLDEVFDSLPYSLLSTRVFLFCFGIFLEAWMWTVFFITWCFWKRPSVLICYSFYLCTAIDFFCFLFVCSSQATNIDF